MPTVHALPHVTKVCCSRTSSKSANPAGICLSNSSTCSSKSSVRLLPVTDASMQPLLAACSSTTIFSSTWQGMSG